MQTPTPGEFAVFKTLAPYFEDRVGYTLTDTQVVVGVRVFRFLFKLYQTTGLDMLACHNAFNYEAFRQIARDRGIENQI